MKKVLDFLAGFVIPKKMEKFVNMKFIFSFLILLSCPFIALSTEKITNRKLSKQALNFPELVYQLDENDVCTNGTEEFKLVINNNKLAENLSNGVYKLEKNIGDKKINLVSIVVNQKVSDQETDAFDISTLFDLEGYLRQEKEENTTYALYVFTKEVVFYVYDLMPIYEDAKSFDTYGYLMYEGDTDSKSEGYKTLYYYLPSDMSEVALNEYGDIDVTKFTKKVEKDATIDFELTGEFAEMTITPSLKHYTNLYKALYGESFTYNVLGKNAPNNEEIKIGKFTTLFSDGVIDFTSNQYWTLSLVASLLMFVFIPLFISLMTWYASKYGKLRKYSQYYGVCAVANLDVAIVSAIVGIFVNYYQYMIFFVAAALIVYMIFITSLTKEKRGTKKFVGNANGGTAPAGTVVDAEAETIEVKEKPKTEELDKIG